VHSIGQTPIVSNAPALISEELAGLAHAKRRPEGR
jgi:hypothetical protein